MYTTSWVIWPGLSVPAVRLLPYLEQHYTREFINNICIVKIDTEVVSSLSKKYLLSLTMTNITDNTKLKLTNFHVFSGS